MAFSKKEREASLKKAGKYLETLSKDLIKDEQDIVNVAKLSIGEAVDIDIDKLEPFPEHTYENYDEDRMNELVKSIKEIGLQTPIILWDNGGDKYIILAGHNRVKAHKTLGYTKIPAIIKKNLSKEEATIIVNQTNMVQRAFESLSLYEKASSIYQIKVAKEDFEKLHPNQNNENEENKKTQTKQSSIRSLEREFGIYKSQIAIYLTLYQGFNKSKKWFSYMENTKDRRQVFDMNTGIVLCKLDKKILKALFEYIDDNNITKISKEQAKALVEIVNNKSNLEYKDMNKVLILEPKNKKANKPITFKRELLNDYFPKGATEEEIMNEIIEMLKQKKEQFKS